MDTAEFKNISNKVKTFCKKVDLSMDNGTFDKDDVYELLYNEGNTLIAELNIIKNKNIKKDDIEKLIKEINEYFEPYFIEEDIEEVD